ncbi:helix-turn-helix transcriptional regulator [Microbispora sp. ATCC PTA-5024]|uniref:helix-turn-helix transcriptional regulator n=1 Tax=Microbispora sp. ATCC PTA-5024 TaxID=316330 RepID=UPI0003DD0364|nr:helix-turn-helix transcriptional regulator [Microbispora sp. ATCC PTA-5024]ETK37946.1 DNA-binding protein [Microbispora sp. ATCC PTA-5024]
MGGDRSRRVELGAFLRAQRGRLRPADVGLPEDLRPGLRRTPGLRREEVAELAGLSLTWYTWLEQGRDIAASAQVVGALARALRLDPDQYRHLCRLAGLAAPEPDAAGADGLLRLQRLVDAAVPNCASVYDARFDFVVWNSAYARLRHDPALLPESRRNLLWIMFADDVARARMVRWEAAARAVLNQVRVAVGERPEDPRLAGLVAELAEESPEFRRWWAEYPDRYFRPATIGVDHPEAGRVDLVMYQLRPVERPDLLMVLQVPATGADLRRVTALLDASPA